MNVLTIHSASSTSSVVRATAPAVYVDGQRRYDLHVESWSELPAPKFGVATLALAMSGRYRRGRGIEDVAALPGVASRVQICLAPGHRHPVFDGIVTKHLVDLGPDREQLGIEIRDALAARLSPAVVGRWEVSGSLPVFIPGGRCAFNGGPNGSASPSSYTIGSSTSRIFDSGEEGQLWSVADIITYLVAAHVPADIAISGLEDLEDIGGEVYPSRLSLTGQPVGQAIAHTCGLAGLAVRGDRHRDAGSGRGIVIYRPGRTGIRRAIKLQHRGTTLDLRRTDLWKGGIRFRRRPARRSVLILGAKKAYESTFQLQPGWDFVQATYHYRDFIRSEAADWPAVADVYRKWVLNEARLYCDEPYNLDAFDFTTISSEDFLLSRQRRFLPCLSRGPDGRGLGIVVEASYDEGSTWQCYGGAVRISEAECTIHLTDDALPANYFQAVRAGTAKFRVTATVTADRRLSAQVQGDTAQTVEVVELPTARWTKVHAESMFYNDPDLLPPFESDDTERLRKLAETLSCADAGAAEARIVLGRVDPTFHIGDIIPRVEGRGLELAPFPGVAPHIREIEHRCGQEWTTHLTVSG